MLVRLEHQQKEIKNVDSGKSRLHTDVQRVNALIAKNSRMQEILENDSYNLQNEIIAELKDTEEEAANMEDQIDQVKDQPNIHKGTPAYLLHK